MNIGRRAPAKDTNEHCLIENFMNMTAGTFGGPSRRTHYFNRNVRVSIRFFCAAPRAKSVELVGDFNEWQPLAMSRSADGWWLAQVELSEGDHRYRFLVDGQPTLDPHATGIARDERNEQASLIAVS